MRKCHWGRNRRCNLNLVSFYFTVVLILVSTSFVIWNFRDECFQFHMPPSDQHYEKCRQRKPKPDLITFEFTKVPVPIVWKKLNVLSSEDKNQVHRDRDLRTALGPVLKKPQSTGLRSTTEILNSDEPEKYKDVDHFKEIQSNVSDYFKNRREQTKASCLKLFYDEESLNFDTTDEGAFFGELQKLEKLERGEKKFFLQTAPQKRTKWLFYKHTNNVDLSWCPLYKSASTPWMAIFTKLSNALTDITESKIKKGKITFVDLATNFRLYTPHDEIHSDNNKAPKYSMVVVRHPFKRLLSAYQDKIERVKGREFYHSKYSQKILRRFRPPVDIYTGSKSGKGAGRLAGNNIVPAWYLMALDIQNRYNIPNKKRPSTTNPSPNDLTTTIDTTRDTQKIQRPAIKPSKLEAPTFLEFCKYLLTVQPKFMDEHWRPQYLDCSPCHHKFDLILKVETLEKDKKAVFKLLGYESKEEDNNDSPVELNELEEVWKRWTNPSVHGHNVSYYFSQLSEPIMQDLYQIYETDFQLFDYSPDEYFDMVKK